MSSPTQKIQNSFYGKKSLSWKVRLQRKEREFESSVVPLEYRSCIDSPPRDWKCFYRQDEAFAYARRRVQSLHVFAYESPSFVQQHGQRLYLVASYVQFWHYYKQLARSKRHHYEVIPNGSVCHLYFDLEFSIPHNPDRDGSEMTQTFIKYICGWIQKCFDIKCSKDDVLMMEARKLMQTFWRSTTFIDRVEISGWRMVACKGCEIRASPYIHHFLPLISTQTMHSSQSEGQGNFVKSCMSYVWEYGGPTSTSTDEHDAKLNREIRGTSMETSSKCTSEKNMDSDEKENKIIQRRALNGESSTMSSPKRKQCDSDADGTCCPSPSKQAKYSDQPKDKVKEESNKLTACDLKAWGISPAELSKFIVKDKHGKDTLFCDTGVYTKNRNFRLYLSCKMGKDNPLILAKENTYKPDVPDELREKQLFMDALVANVEYTSDLRVLAFESSGNPNRPFGLSQSSIQSQEDSMVGYEHSPYPELDQFIRRQVQRGGVEGYVRRWTYFPQRELMLYDIGRNRYCNNVGRPHRSNNIMLMADLRASVFYQKCHDPECKAMGYKSKEKSLPMGVLPWHLLPEEDDFSLTEELEDDDLLQAVCEAEQTLQKTNLARDTSLLDSDDEVSQNHTTKSDDNAPQNHPTKSDDNAPQNHTTKSDDNAPQNHTTKSNDDAPQNHPTKSDDEAPQNHPTKNDDNAPQNHPTKNVSERDEENKENCSKTIPLFGDILAEETILEDDEECSDTAFILEENCAKDTSVMQEDGKCTGLSLLGNVDLCNIKDSSAMSPEGYDSAEELF